MTDIIKEMYNLVNNGPFKMEMPEEEEILNRWGSEALNAIEALKKQIHILEHQNAWLMDAVVEEIQENPCNGKADESTIKAEVQASMDEEVSELIEREQA